MKKARTTRGSKSRPPRDEQAAQEFRDGVRYRAKTIPDKRKESSRRACRNQDMND